MRRTFVLALAVLVLGCSRGAQPPAAGDENATALRVAANTEFTLATGHEASIDGGRLTVRFLAVESDSRCPVDVQCVWAGDAAVALRLVPRDSAARIDTIHSTLDPTMIAVAGYQLHLVDVSPAPRSTTHIAPDDYRVKLRADAAD